MTKKDYKKIAKLLANHPCACTTQWQRFVLDFVDVLKEDNPNFDKNKFFDACGWTADGYRR